MAEQKKRSGGFVLVYNSLKLLAAALGLVVTVLGLMSLGGVFLENIWVHLVLALIIVVGVPLVLSELVLPKEADKGQGMFTEIFALVWLGGGLAFLAVGSMGPLFAAEAARLEPVIPLASQTASWLAGSAQQGTEPPALVAAEADAGADAGAEESDGGAAEADAGEGAAPSVEPPDDGPLTPAQLFKKYAPSVVTIQVRGPRGEGGGTGFLLDKDGTIATNQHVVEGASKIRVKFFEGKWIEEVELLASDASVDLAILRLKAEGELAPCYLGDSDGIVVGEEIVSIGNPLGLEHTLTDGLVSSRRIWKGRKMIQMSVPVSPGNSGGPIFNAKGHVVGITTYKLGNAFNRGENLNLAVPVNVLKSMLRVDYPGAKKFSSSTW